MRAVLLMSADLEELEAGELLDVIRKALALVPSARVRTGSLEALEELERRIVEEDDDDDDDDAGEEDGDPW